ncbi:MULTISPECIES: NAD(P)/FAD-dependent oxidoreductase [unclassified Acinetobacter]|uniref:NAD(P)/FAD-dependent oxidoreductase n=1 Tax=unclassified Acinetobacter TaxID=196816 RepID=UPI002934C47F|nr:MULTISPECIES: NAD(P)/FAD-dependent oxidoreductase [unclassified Acinetobacter]WOE33184.1 NAD(P)/FAD-dependent oxidoreductase [Acinetobacter sp. SAAs470]WOE39845.1 NAD(P)/FAD-dependent oxidoreductase [Acinetobacter sp. SAAs474]
MAITQHVDVLIIGAGPSGSSAAALLRKKGYQVTIIEKQYFPRFSIGESLLPQSMVFLEEAGLLETIADHVNTYAFQYKNGAAFLKGSQRSHYDFREKFTAGPGTTWQVRRAEFDHLLATQAQKMGAEIRFGHEVVAVNIEPDQPILTVKNAENETYQIQAKFLLDASGFGRILPKLLDLEQPSDFPVRRAIFTHIEDGILDHPDFDREKILITVHEKDPRAWYWLIPFADGRSSFGIVAEQDFFEQYGQLGQSADELQQRFKEILADDPSLSQLLTDAKWDTPVRTLVGYSANVKQLAAKNFALLGNAGEFLDPVFSSGVTIALKSSSMVVPLVEQVLQGHDVDWMEHYEKPLRQGIQVFRAYVEAWYSGAFQDIVFCKHQQPRVRLMISALLAGYAWDQDNPLHRNTQQHLATLTEYCREQ